MLRPETTDDAEISALLIEARLLGIRWSLALLVLRRAADVKGLGIEDEVIRNKAHGIYGTGRGDNDFDEDQPKPWGRPPKPDLSVGAVIPKVRDSRHDNGI